MTRQTDENFESFSNSVIPEIGLRDEMAVTVSAMYFTMLSRRFE